MSESILGNLSFNFSLDELEKNMYVCEEDVLQECTITFDEE